MAYDGSLKFDTKLDTSGFEKGAKEIAQEAKDLGKQVESAGKGMDSALKPDMGKVQEEVNKAGKAFVTAHTKLEAFNLLIKQFQETINNFNAAETVEDATRLVDQLKIQAEMMKELGVPNDMNAYEAMQAGIKDAEQALAEFIAIREQAQEAITVDNTPDTEGFEAGTKRAQTAIEYLRDKLSGFGAEVKQAFDSSGLNPFISDTEKAKQEAASFKRTLEGLRNADTPAEAEQIIGRAKAIADTYAKQTYADKAAVDQMNASLNEMTEAVRANAAAWREDQATQHGVATTSGWDEMLRKWQEMPTASGMALSALRSGLDSIGQAAGSAGALITSALHDPVGAADRALYGIASAAAHAAQGLLGLAKGALGTAANGLRTIAGHAANAARNLAKMAANAAVGAFKKLGGMITGIGNSTGKMNGGFKLSLGTILKYAFGIRSLYFLFNKLRRALVDGFQDIMTSDTSLKNTVNSLKQSLGNLKLAFASAIAPIAKIVLPALTTMINALADAVNMVGMFIVALTGQKTFKKATAAQEGYAEAAGSAADALKEEKRQLAGFDQLEILSDSGSGGSGGGGSGGSGSGTTFEDVAIDSGLVDWAEKLKEMFRAGDWAGIGAVIAEGINGAFAKLDELIKWENVGTTIRGYVNAFCGIFNSLVDNINWELIGKTVGDGINTLLHTADLLLTGIDWENLGKKISEGLNGVVSSIDWELLGKTLGDKFAAKLKLLTSAAINFDWANLGTKLSEGINSLSFTILTTLNEIKWAEMGKNFAAGLNKLISGVGWATIGETVGSAFNSVLYTIYGDVTEFDWKEAGKKLGDAVNGMADKIDWSTFGATVGEAIKGALEGIAGFIETVDWGKLVTDIGEFIAGVDWSGIASALFEAIGAVFGAGDAIGEIIWGAIKDGLLGIKDYFDESIDDAGGNVAEGILNGIAGGFKALGTWVKENILEPFLEGFRKAFGISSPAKDASLLEAAGYVGEGILEGIAGVFKNIASWVENHILGPIRTALDNPTNPISVGIGIIKNGWTTVSGWIKGDSGNGGSLLGGVVEKGIGVARDGWTTIAGWVKGSLLGGAVEKGIGVAREGWTTIAGWVLGGYLGGVVEKGISVAREGWTTIAGWVLGSYLGGVVNKGVSVVRSGWTNLSSFVKTYTGGVVNKGVSVVRSGWTNLSAFVKKYLGGAVNKGVGVVRSGWDNLKNFVTGYTGGDAYKGVNVTRDGWSNLKSFVIGYTGDAVSKGVGVIQSGWTSLQNYLLSNTGAAVSKSVGLIQNGWSTVASWVSDLVGGTVSVGVSLFKSGWSSIKSFFGLSGGGIVAGNGGIKLFGSGGYIRDGSWFNEVQKYASGTSKARGSLFVAGEGGPEIVGHVNGRTEVLNKSQIASAVYAAVTNGMAAAVNALGGAILLKMAECTNAIVAAAALTANTPVEISPVSLAAGSAALLAGLNDIARSAYMAPVLSRGTVVPYAASQAADTADIANAISAANTDMTDTLVQAIAAAATMIVTAVNGIDTQTQVDRAALARYTIDEINRRTAMFQSSPIRA